MSSESVAGSPSPSKAAFWTGWVLGVVPCLLFVMSGVMKLLRLKEVVEGMAKSGFPDHLLLGLGIVELTCTILYLIPQTAVLGAILLTGYMGGAIVTHLRLGEPFWLHILIGVALWLGLYLRDPRLRALAPFRTFAPQNHLK
ncbi:MAG: DoxX family protein [Pirellulales bacterium]